MNAATLLLTRMLLMLIKLAGLTSNSSTDSLFSTNIPKKKKKEVVVRTNDAKIRLYTLVLLILIRKQSQDCANAAIGNPMSGRPAVPLMIA